MADQNYIEILRAEIATFDVDLTQTQVAAASATLAPFQTAVGGNYNFAQADNFIIKSAWVCFPYCFSQGSGNIGLECFGYDGATQFDLLLGTTNGIFIPTENVETELNQFIRWDISPNGLKWGIFGELSGGVPLQISMLNVPSELDGVEGLPVWAYVKIFHNMPIIA